MSIIFLPNDILGIITSDFNIYELLNLELVCKTFFNTMDVFLWEFLPQRSADLSLRKPRRKSAKK